MCSFFRKPKDWSGFKLIFNVIWLLWMEHKNYVIDQFWWLFGWISTKEWITSFFTFLFLSGQIGLLKSKEKDREKNVMKRINFLPIILITINDGQKQKKAICACFFLARLMCVCFTSKTLPVWIIKLFVRFFLDIGTQITSSHIYIFFVRRSKTR